MIKPRTVFMAIALTFVYLSLTRNKETGSAKASAKISPTAHYTSYVWIKNGLSDQTFYTRYGWILYNALEPLMCLSRMRGGPTIEEAILTRHKLIDLKLTEEIEAGRVTQIIEIAAGLSPRGMAFTKKYGARIKYVEADLTAMAALKTQMLATHLRNSTLRHEVVVVNALEESGDQALASVVASKFSPELGGIAVITEGLVNYFDQAAVEGMWSRFATATANYPHGIYLSDIHLSRKAANEESKLFVWLLSSYVRGGVHLHYSEPAQAEAALMHAGFTQATLLRPVDWSQVDPTFGTEGSKTVNVLVATSTSNR